MPAPKLKGLHSRGRRTPMSEGEIRRNLELHLLHGYGLEYAFPSNETYQEHHRELTHTILKRAWPDFRDRLTKEWGNRDGRPFAWWLVEAPAALRSEYMTAWKADYEWRMNGDAEEPGESLNETQERLLNELGMLPSAAANEGDNEP